MNERKVVILKSTICIGILPAILWVSLRFVIFYGFDFQRIDAEFVGTSFVGLSMLLLISYFAGARYYSRTRNKSSS